MIGFGIARSALLGFLGVLLVGGAAEAHPAAESTLWGSGTTVPVHRGKARVDTGRVEAALQHFYDLYTSRDFDVLYARAAGRIREGGMSKADFRRFMRKKRKRLGPVQTATIDVSETGAESKTVRATATVTYANGRQVERWKVTVQNGAVRWLSFRTIQSKSSDPSKRAEAARHLEVGAPVPSFEVSALRDSARTFTPSDFEDQYVLLNFWATWCAPCIDKIPTLQTAYRRYEDAFTLLNLSLDRSRATVVAFLENHNLPGHHAFVGMERFQSPLTDRFKVNSIPSPILVGPNGQIVATERQIERVGLLRMLGRKVGGTE